MRTSGCFWRYQDHDLDLDLMEDLGKIKESKVLAEIVMNSYGYIELIANPEWAIFEKIVKWHHLREAALERISDQRLLATVAVTNVIYNKVREINGTMFRNIQHCRLSANSIPDKELEIQMAAVKKITDNMLLEEIIRDIYSESSVWTYALENLTDQNIINDLAVNGIWERRLKAIEYVLNTNLLEQIAEENEDNRAGEIAKRRLKYLQSI